MINFPSEFTTSMSRGFFLLFVMLFAAKISLGQCNGSPAQCLGSQSYTVTPAAVNGQYTGGTVVTFCYSMTNYNQCNSNWFHTLDIDLGPGWDASSIAAVTIPNSCDGQGDWGFYNSVTSVNTGQTFGPCFSYDSPLGNPLFVQDGIPGNNYGDNCNTYTWTFCFSVQVAVGCSNQSLSVDVTAIGDGTAGSWGSSTCPGMPFNICNATCAECPLDVYPTITDPTCYDNDGIIELSIDSAKGPVTFTWLPGGQTDSVITGLSSGTYTVVVEDSVGCQVLDTFDLEYNNPVIFSTFSTDASCYGYCDGSIFLFALGGTAPYIYTWSNGQTNSFDTTLCTGTYYVSVSDANSCMRFDTLTINEPTQIVLTPSHTDASCFGLNDGTASIAAVGGAGNYTYSWVPTNQTTSAAAGLIAGPYTVVVTDAAGCFADTVITVGSPPQILFNAILTDPSCYGFFDGSIVTNVSQGVPPYQYLWMNNGNTTSSISGLPLGSYPLLVTDANGCTELDTLILSQPDSLIGEFDIKTSSCQAAADGSIAIYVSGGTSPYYYVWNGNSSLVGSGIFGQLTGDYSVLVTDAHGCSFIMTDKIPSMDELEVDAGNDTAIELGTRATLHALVSRSGDFNYKWTPGYHVVDSFAAVTPAYPYYTTLYSVNATETGSGCTANDSVLVTILPTDYVLFPSAFSPNGDGLNDVFLPVQGNLITVESFRIFNRWGNLIFDDNTQGWDGTFSGKPEEMGTYVYELAYKVEGRNETYHKQGSVTLLR